MEIDFKTWLSFDESARKSLARTMGKFQTSPNKPLAILTAFRGDFDLKKNRSANKQLEMLFKLSGLSFYPVIGAGQENEGGIQRISKEESYVVSPINDMDEPTFINTIKKLLYSPDGVGTEHAQWGALVKLPSRSKAFLLHHDEEGKPNSPDDYDQEVPLGKSARPRRGKEMKVKWRGQEYPTSPDLHFTQMTKGPQASSTMKGDVDDEDTRRRFTISKGRFF